MTRPLLRLLKAIGSGIRAGWLILGITLIAVLVIETGARLALGTKTGLTDWLQNERWITDFQAHRPESRIGAAEDRNSVWFQDLRKEQDATQFIPRPYIHWRQRPYQGRYLNIDQNGLRATWNPLPQEDPDDSSPAVHLFTFGGSTMWGWGARDDYTIASYLSKLLHERGYRAQVTNYGEIAYVSTQEVVTLLRCIQRGEVPDIALFYDGSSEVSVSYLGREMGRDLLLTDAWQSSRKSTATSAPHGRLADGRAFLRKNLWGSHRLIEGLQRRILPRTSANAGAQSFPVNDELARRIIRRYQANLTLVEALGRYYGFESLFYWQPTLYSKRRRSPYEQTINGSFLRYEGIFNDIYHRVRASEFLNGYPRFHDLSALFDDSEEPYYTDPAHLSEAGNRLVAEAVVGDVIELIEQRRSGVARSERSE